MLDSRTHRSLVRTSLMRGLLSAGVLGLVAVPAQANVSIPEGGAVTPDSVFIVHFQVREGCDGAPTDGLEVTIPENVENPQPESMPGWLAEVDTLREGEDAPRTVVRWTGGVLEADAFMQFGLRARFPDEPDATLAFPVVQSCGVLERAWTGDDAPTVTLAPRFGPRDVIELSATVEQLQRDLGDIDTRLGGVDPVNLRSRVSEVEQSLGEIEETVEQLSQALEELQAPIAVSGGGSDADASEGSENGTSDDGGS